MDKGNHYYIECPVGSGVCNNPIYVCKGNESFNINIECQDYNKLPSEIKVLCDKGFCDNPKMVEGESIGVKPPFIISAFNYLFIILLLLSFVINHLVYNKCFSFKKLLIEGSENVEDNNKK